MALLEDERPFILVADEVGHPVHERCDVASMGGVGQGKLSTADMGATSFESLHAAPGGCGSQTDWLGGHHPAIGPDGAV